MQELLSFWFVSSAPRALAAYRRTIAGFEANLAVATTAKNLGKPLFQDYTFQGRIIGFGFRILRIVFGSLLYILIGVLFATLYLIWLGFPLFCVVSLVGSFFAPPISSDSQPQVLEDTWKP